LKSLQLILETVTALIAGIPEARFVALGIAVIGLTTLLLTVGLSRLSRKSKKIDALVLELQTEVDRLRQAEERRALADLRSNRAFLQNLALELADTNPEAVPTEISENVNAPHDLVYQKLSSTG